jgi:glycosyltransferase involved in cell wall biosynthesis
MKKILLLDTQYTTGGPKTVLYNLVHSYLGKKYDFRLIAKGGVLHYNPFKAAKYVNFYRKHINQEHGDIAYVRGLQYVGFLMTLAAKLSNVKEIILCIHGSDWDVPEHTLRRTILKYIIEPLEIRMADHVITVCDAESKIVGALKCARKGAYYGTIYNTFPDIDYDQIAGGKLRNELGIPKDKIIVATVGRVVVRKGHQYVIEAIKKIKDPDFVFVTIGDGEYLENYKTQCAEEIRDGRLFLLGARNDVYELLKDVDIFLFATLNENHSMALLEAVSMRCAALVTKVGGNPEIIQDGISGLLIEPESSDQIVSGLNKLKDKRLREQYAAEAYAYAKSHFSVQNTLGKLEKLFDGDH